MQRKRRRPVPRAGGALLLGLAAVLILAHQERLQGLSASPTEAAFLQEMSPLATKAAQATGMPANFFLTQWALESNWGTSEAFRIDDNAAGILPWAHAAAGRDPKYAGYASLSAFEQGAVAFYEDNGRYHGLLRAAQQGASTQALLKMLGQSGYATDPRYGTALNTMLATIQKIAPKPVPASVRTTPRRVRLVRWPSSVNRR